MSLFKRKKQKKIPSAGRSGKSLGKSGVLTSLINGFLEDEYSGLLSAKPATDMIIDLKPIVSGESLNFLVKKGSEVKITDMTKIDAMTASCKTLGLLLPFDMCTTRMFFLKPDETDFYAMQSVIPYSLSEAEYQVSFLGGGVRKMGLISSFPSEIKAALESNFIDFMDSGGSISVVTDRIFPLTQYVSNRIEIKEPIISVEQKGEELFVWCSVNLDGLILPVNGQSFRIPPMDSLNATRSSILFVLSEFIRRYKFAHPKEGFIIFDGNTISLGVNRDDLENLLRELKIPTVKTETSKTASIEGYLESVS